MSCNKRSNEMSFLEKAVKEGVTLFSAGDARAASRVEQDHKKINQLDRVLKTIKKIAKSGGTNYLYRGSALYEEVVVELHKLGYVVCLPSTVSGFTRGGDMTPVRNVIRWDSV